MTFKFAQAETEDRTKDFVSRSGEITKRGDHQNKDDNDREPKPETPFDKDQAVADAQEYLTQLRNEPESSTTSTLIPETGSSTVYWIDSEGEKDEGPTLGSDGKQTPTLTSSQAKKEKTENYKIKHFGNRRK